MPLSETDFVGGHAVCAIGYDDNTQLIQFLNCWGIGWGKRGFGYLPYEYFETYFSDAWLQCPNELGRWRPECSGDKIFVKRSMMFAGPLGHSCAIIDLWNMVEDIRIAWCFMTYRDGYIEIEDFFVRPEFQGSHYQQRLARAVVDFAVEEHERLRLWVAHADNSYYAANFSAINDFVQTAALKVRRSHFLSRNNLQNDTLAMASATPLRPACG
jgi:GNAT superfamily N-acetyltransferase